MTSNFKNRFLIMPTQNVFIIGSGFSASFGLPTQNGLFSLIMKSPQRKGENDKNEILNALEFLYPHFNKNKPCFPSFEEFLTLVEQSIDFENGIFDEGYWAGKKKCALRLLTDFISKKSKKIAKKRLLDKFIKILEPEDVIISFNWDNLIETSCLRQKKKINFQGRDSSKVSLLKLHGSLNWGIIPKKNGLSKPASASYLFRKEIFLVKNYKYCDSWDQINEGPYIIPPILTKRPPSEKFLNKIWYEGFNSLVEAKKIVVIGYSLPPEDLQARTLIVSGLKGNPNQPSLLLVDPDPKVAGKYFSEIYSKVKFIQQRFDNSALVQIGKSL